VVADEVLLGDYKPVGQLSENAQVSWRINLIRAVNNVGVECHRRSARIVNDQRVDPGQAIDPFPDMRLGITGKQCADPVSIHPPERCEQF
jgi:hypothetical protein